MIKYNGINHLAMATRDMDGTIRFWRDLLEMRLVAGLGKPGYRTYFLQISDQDLIGFFEWPTVMPIEEKDHGYPVKGPFVFDHVSFGVESEEDLWTLKDKLTAADIWASELVDHGFIRSVYTFDPNGIAIEFSWSVPGVDIRAEPRMMDTAPSNVTLEGPEPQANHWPPVTSPTPLDERHIYPGEGDDLVSGTRHDWFAGLLRKT
jgi:catechol 2,3-dioxygenase-like lactoylglutathione lyase family enzyme